jgi:hypothetical protein
MLATTLRQILRAQDAARLFAALGYQPDDLPYQDGTRVIARWRGVKVVAVDAEEPGEAARALARRLATAGERALAVAVGPGRELALAAPHVGGPGITRLLSVSLDAPEREALDRLERLRPVRGASGLTHALRISELLTSEAAGDRFFAAFRVALERMAAAVDARHARQDRRMVALLALTRVLFLYFVQHKGWLDGREDFLRHLLDDALARGRPFHRAELHPLFFGTLNRPPAARSARLGRSRIPYLNGGLFEPHPVERRLRMPCFSNALWRDAFDGLFERFRFCVREAHEVDAVAPDMLGRVFERLMHPDERHVSGTFYTPETVVRQLVDAALETGLAGAGGLSPEVAQSVVQRLPVAPRDATRALVALRDLRLLDPAAGSGAFLLGALEALTEMRLALERSASPVARRRIRHEVLRENLFGVDLNPVAVRLAELRLWLAVVADDPTEDPVAVAPLPNLDGVVRQGDTLLDPLAAARAIHGALSDSAPAPAAQAVRAARARLFDARGEVHARSLKELRGVEIAVARAALDSALAATERALADLAAAAGGRDLFGRRAGLTRAQQDRWRTLRGARGELRRARTGVDQGALPFFAFEVHAPDVLARGGFSVVVGNPPWVRAERLSPPFRRTLRERFTWWRGGRARGYAHQPDLAVAFLQRAVELSTPGGAVGLLLPSKIASAGYAEIARRRLVRETTIAYAHRVPDREAARFGAAAYPLAVVVRKAAPPPDHMVRVGFDGSDAVPQAALDAPGPWRFLPDRTRAALDAFRQGGPPLGDCAPPALGVKTGADRLLLGELIQLADGDALVRFGAAQVVIELAVLRAAIRGQDVRPFRARPRRVLLWGYDRGGQALEHLPPRAARYVEERRRALERRTDYRGGPVWTLFRTRPALRPNRVIWADIARQPRAVAIDESDAAHAVPLNSCYVAPAPDRETALAVAGVLNSTWALAFAAAGADEARGGYRRINARVTAQIPIPPARPARRALVDLVADAHHGNPLGQDDLDRAVADALDLSAATCRELRQLAAHLGD